MSAADGEVLTLAQVAQRLQVKPRWLADFIKRKQVRVLRSGRIVRFDALALDDLENALRCYGSSAEKTRVRSRLPGRLQASAFADALRLTTVVSRKKKPMT